MKTSQPPILSDDDLLSVSECARRSGFSRHRVVVAAALSGVILRRTNHSLGLRVADFELVRAKLDQQADAPVPAA